MHAIYSAVKLKEYANFLHLSDVGVLEIGGGLGRTAFYAYTICLKNYTLVDVPMTAISAGFLLSQSLGTANVAFTGEARKSDTQIKILHPDEYFNGSLTTEITLNVDSLTEMGKCMSKKYLDKAASNT
jgi:hypothetical protein